MERKVIAVFGAGPGLGASLAERFGREGHSVALVARRREPMEALKQSLIGAGIESEAFRADLANEDGVWSVTQAILRRYGRIDAVYYAPASTEAFLPASLMTAPMMRERLNLLFLGLVDVVDATLPGMRERGQGTILAAMGGSAAAGLPFMSGPAPAQAATRNYLQSLHGELAGEGIHVAFASISGVIRGSAYHQSVKAGEADAADTFEMPMVDPDEVADKLWASVEARSESELCFPSSR